MLVWDGDVDAGRADFEVGLCRFWWVRYLVMASGMVRHLTCRSMVSATSFTLVGVINKFLTILLNVFIWDKHASATGILALILGLLGGTFYRQAPPREGGGGGGSKNISSSSSSYISSKDSKKSKPSSIHKGSRSSSNSQLDDESVANQFEMTGLLEDDKEEV